MFTDLHIGAVVQQATAALQATGIATPRLDTLVLLGDLLGKDKNWLLAHPEARMSPHQALRLEAQVQRRLQRIPLAYIRGNQAFYGRDFAVSPAVLIPRPETEAMLTFLQRFATTGRLLDVGTGSGAIAVTAALELPRLRVEACDISPTALAVARKNAARLRARVRFFQSDLLQNATDSYNIITANLPYVSRLWQRSPETDNEPPLALFAPDDGLALIYRLIAQAPANLPLGGHLLLEADPRQHGAVIQAAHWHGFHHIETQGLVLAFANN